MSDNEENRTNAHRRGNRLGFWFFGVSLRLVGLRGAYGLLYFVCAYYFIFDGAARRSAMPYIQRRFPTFGPIRRCLAVYRLFISQGKQLVDRAYHCSGMGRLEMDILGFEQLEQLTRSDRGFLLLTAHLGNWQLAMTALGRLKKEVLLVMRTEDNPAVHDALGIDRCDSGIRRVSPDGFLGGVVEVMNAIDGGAVVSIMADRCYDKRSLPVDYLGAPAAFPYGAYAIAASAECPIVILLSAKTGPKHYVIDVQNIMYPKYERGREKKSQLQGWVQSYARIVEDYAMQYPYQVFLFHDLWNATGALITNPAKVATSCQLVDRN